MLDYEKIYRSILKIRKHSYYTARIIMVIAVVLVASVAMNIYSVTRVENLQSQMNEMKKRRPVPQTEIIHKMINNI